MLRDIGQKIRQLRTQKGIGLNVFADKLGVSSGYLSNLENGKTDTIQLTLLEKIQDELTIFPNQLIQSLDIDDNVTSRLKRIDSLLRRLHNEDPKQADYLLTMVEKGLDLFLPTNE
ncbi:helix-turn-helix domain-containing protein [Neobacillus vireti]|uniref:helix-turn-helix domain-containing protein n=1 Tax=Neobacillus vireti TaxID=220686 RepID=UPI003000F185